MPFPQKPPRPSLSNYPGGWTLRTCPRPPLTSASGKPLSISLYCLVHFFALTLIITVCLVYLHREGVWQTNGILESFSFPSIANHSSKGDDTVILPPSVRREGKARIVSQPQHEDLATLSKAKRVPEAKLKGHQGQPSPPRRASNAEAPHPSRAGTANPGGMAAATKSGAVRPSQLSPSGNADSPQLSPRGNAKSPQLLPTGDSIPPWPLPGGNAEPLRLSPSGNAKSGGNSKQSRTLPGGSVKPGGNAKPPAKQQRHADAMPGVAPKQPTPQKSASTATPPSLVPHHDTAQRSARPSSGDTPTAELAKCVAGGSRTSNKGPPLPNTFAALRPSPDWAAAAREWQEGEQCRDGAGGPGSHPNKKQASPWTLWWTEEAEAVVISQLQANQFPQDCSQGTWLAARTRSYGLLSSFHVFAAELVFAVAVGWTAVPLQNYDSASFQGCPENNLHLGCFLNFTSCGFGESKRDPRLRALRGVRAVKWHKLNPKNVAYGSVVYPESAMPTDKNGPWRKRVNGWFRAIWQTMLDGDMVGTYGGMQANLTEEWRKEFLIMSIVTKWLFNPHPHIKELSHKILRPYEAPTSTEPHVGDREAWRMWKAPVLGLHIRQTDKTTEDPFYTKFKRYREPSEYGQAIRLLEEQQEYSWGTLLLMSDSGSAVQKYLDDPRGAGLRDNLTIIHDHTLSDSVENYGGHDKVPGEKKKEMQEHFLAMLYIMSEIADYAIITMSSNVGRFIFECLGARKRVEQTSGLGPLGLSMDGETNRWWNDFSH